MARVVSAVISISAASAGFMVAMMLVPAGVTAAASGSSVIWNSVRRAVEDRGVAFDVKGEHRRADHDDEVVAAQRFRELTGRGVQKARELRMRFRKAASRRKRADPDGGAGLLGEPHHQLDGLRAIDGGADHKRRLLAGRERLCQAPDGVGIGAQFARDAACRDGLRRLGPVVDRHRDESRPARRLHRHIIGTRDRSRHVFGARRFDCEFDIRPRKFGCAFGKQKRLQRQDRARLLACGDHERRLVAIGRENIAERVADAGGRMQIDEAGIAGRLRIAVGHADHGRFLQAQHVVDIVRPVAQERQFGRAGIAEHFSECRTRATGRR